MASGLQAEDELHLAQAEFDKQAEVTKLLLEDISSTHVRRIHTHPYHTTSPGDRPGVTVWVCIVS